MNSKSTQSLWLQRLGTSVCATLVGVNASAAYANQDRGPGNLNNFHARSNWRALHHDLIRSSVKPNSLRNVIGAGHATNAMADRIVRSTYVNDLGNIHALRRGVSLDLSSAVNNITVGTKLLGDSSVTIEVGGVTKEVTAGSRLTPAEYAALSQKMSTGNQGLTLDAKGSATGGLLNLNQVSDDGRTIRASELVIPENVSVLGDFARAADGVRVSKDVVNSGSIFALSSNLNANRAIIGARDINNESGGLITTNVPDAIAVQAGSAGGAVNLALKADRDINNAGSITSSGDLELSAGRSINNVSTKSVMSAHGNVTLSAADISNVGNISSTEKDVTLTGPSNARLEVNNAYGNISALNGAINVREADYAGSAKSIVYGGNLLSKELDINAGGGEANVTVKQLTGEIKSTGEAVHVSADTAKLKIGSQCLTGDPTYYNTGDVNLLGDIDVGEDLAIIAGGYITTDATDLVITARSGAGKGFNINIIAGVDVVAGSKEISPAGGPADLPSQPPITQNTNAPVTFKGLNTTTGGGDIDFSTANSVTINSNSTSGNNSGGNITLAAYDDGFLGAGGIYLPTLGSINSGGFGTGNNGNVSVIAGSTLGSITLPNIDTTGGSGTGGNVVIANAQPALSSGPASSITFNTSGAITSGNFFVPSATVQAASDITLEDVVANGDVTIRGGFVTLDTGITAKRVTITSLDEIDFTGDIVAPGGILMVARSDIFSGNSLNTSTTGNAGNITIVSGANFTQNANDITINGDAGTGGSIVFDFPTFEMQALIANSTGGNGNAGNINLISFGSVSTLPVLAVSNTINLFGNGTGSSGTLTVVGSGIDIAGVNTATGGAAGTGAVFLRGGTPEVNVPIETTAGNFANVKAGFTFLTGALTASDISVGNITTIGGTVDITSGRNLAAGNIDASSTLNGGSISIQTFGTSVLNIGGAGANSTGTLNVNAAAGNGGLISVINLGNKGITVLTAPTFASALAGATLILDGKSGVLNIANFGALINASASGGNAKGGKIDFAGDSITIAANPVLLLADGNGTGAGGTVSLRTRVSGAGGVINVGTAVGQYMASVKGTGGTINLIAGDALNITNTGVLTADNLNLTADQNITINADVTGTSTVLLSSFAAITTGAGVRVKGGALTLDGGFLPTNISTDVLSVSGGTIGNNIIISELNDINVGSIAVGVSSFTLSAGGNIVFTNDVIANGGINLTTVGTGTMSFSSALNSLMSAGTLTISAGTGNTVLNTKVAALTANSAGLVDLIQGGAITVNASNVDDLRINATGAITISGAIVADPVTMLSTANININNNITANDGILIVSGADITTSKAGLVIDGSNGAGKGGNIVMIAGALFIDNGNDVTINGPSVTGGNLDLNTGGSLATLTTNGTGGDAGQLTLLAYKGAAKGSVILPLGASITVSSAGQKSGNVAIVGGSNGTAVSMGDINTSSGGFVGFGTGNLFISAAQPDESTASLIQKLDATYSGTFVPVSVGASTGAIQTGNLTSNAANIFVKAGGSVTTNNIDASSQLAGNGGGNIIISALNAGNLTTGFIHDNGLGSGSGGGITINLGNGAISYTNIQANGGASGAGGFVVVNANRNAALNLNQIQAITAANQFSAGVIQVFNKGNGGIVVDAGDFNVSSGANSPGGFLNIDALIGGGSLTLNSPTLAVNGSGANSNGTLKLSGTQIDVIGGNAVFEARFGAAGTGGISINTNAPGLITSGNNIDVLTGGILDLNGTINTSNGAVNSGAVTLTGGVINAKTSTITTAGGAPNASGGTINISGTLGSIDIGDLNSNGSGSGNAGSITVQATTGMTVGNVTAKGGATGAGALVLISANSPTPVSINVVDTSAGFAGGGNAGNITIANAGGDLILGTAFQANANTGIAGNISFTALNTIFIPSGSTITANSDGTNGSISFANLIQASGGNLTITSDGLGGGGAINFNGTGPITTSGNDLSASTKGSLIIGASFIDTSGGSLAGDVVLNGADVQANNVNITTSPAVPGNNAGNVTVGSNAAGQVSLGGITASATGAGVGGTVIITSGAGGLTFTGNVDASGAAAGTAGSIAIKANQAAIFNTPLLTANGSASGGSVSVQNSGSGDINVINAIDGNAVSLIAAGLGSINLNANVNGSVSVDLFSTGKVTQSLASTISGGAAAFNVGAGPVSLHTDVVSIDAGIGGSLTINEDTALTLGNIAANDFTVTGKTGDITVSKALNIANGISITASGGNLFINKSMSSNKAISLGAAGNISIIDTIVGNTAAGSILLTSTNGNISTTGLGSVTTGIGSTGLTVDLNGVTPGTATLVGTVSKISGLNAGTINLNNGATAIQVGAIGAKQSLNVTTTDAAVGITATSAINTSGTLTFNAPRFFNDKSLTAASILVQNPTGNLDVVGGAPGLGSLNGTVPVAGAPGTPSSPSAVKFLANSSGTISLTGDMGLSGDVEMDSFFGKIISTPSSLFHGLNNISLNTGTWIQQGAGPTLGNITGNNLIINVLNGGTIANPDGDVVFNSNVILSGHDVAILAKGNVILGPNLIIDLSNGTGNGGNLTILAGFTLTPTGTGQVETANPITITGTATGGNVVAGTVSIDTSSSAAGGNGGSVLVSAFNGTITLGSINTSASNGLGGDVKLISQGDITTGNINATGSVLGGSVSISGSTPTISGTPVSTDGTLSGGSIVANPPIAKVNITVGNVNTGSGGISTLTNGGAITVNGTVSATIAQFSTTLGAGGSINFATTNKIDATADSFGNGGGITLISDKITVSGGSLTLNAIGTANGGFVTYKTLDNTALNVGTGGNLITDAHGGTAGGVTVIETGGDLNLNTGGLNAAGKNGTGAFISLTAGGALNLNDISFTTQSNATGANSSGGTMSLIGNAINFTSTSAAPLALAAHGNGTGNGGTIVYRNSDQIATFVGTPTKTSKGAAHFLTIDAQSGTKGGSGGSVEVSTGANLTVNPTALLAGPQDKVGKWAGATYTLKAGLTAAKGGSLIITGPISADGTNGGGSGDITVESHSTKAFTVGSTKAPKNGIQGDLTATTGNISVSNLLGGVTISSSTGVTADALELEAGGKGAIAAGKGVVITANSSIDLTAATGAIGKKQIEVVTNSLSANTQGSVNLFDSITAPMVLLDSTGGKGFTLNTNGPTSLNDISTTKGSITIISSATSNGLLQVLPTSVITANSGSLTLQNLDTTNGAILIGTNATVETQQKGKQVSIFIGPTAKGTNTTAPGGVTVNNTGKGVAFFGPIGGVVATTVATVNATNKNVLFNNAGANPITLGTGAVVTADPPSRNVPIFTPLPAGSSYAMSSSSGNVTGTFSSAQGDIVIPAMVPTDIKADGTVSSVISFATMSNATFSGSQQSGLVTTDEAELTIDTVLNQAAAADFEMIEQPSTYGLVDATFHSDREFGMNQQGSRSVSQATGNRYVLKNGNVVFAPSTDVVVETPHGEVALAARSLTLIMESSAALAVYDIDDTRKESVVVKTNGKQFTLSPGRHVQISSVRTDAFEEVNPAEFIQYRGMSKADLENGWKVFASEFSIPSACNTIKPLRHVMNSKHSEAVKLSKHMMKTMAVLMMINGSSQGYQQYFKPRMTAMQ